MNKVWILTKIQLKSAFDVKRVFHIKERKRESQTRYVLLGIAFVLLFGGMSTGYSYGLATTFRLVGMLDMLPPLLMAMACVITLFTTVYKAKGILFHFSDYDMVMSLPVPTGSIVASRIMIVYLYSLAFSSIVLLPGSVIYGMFTHAGVGFYVLTIVHLLFLPLIPITVATLIGLLIAVLSVKFKHANIVNLCLTIALFVGIMGMSFPFDTVASTEQQLANLSEKLNQTVDRIYPFAGIYKNAVIGGDVRSIVLFLGSSLGVFVLYCIIIGKLFKKINSSMNAARAKSNYRLQSLKQTSVFYSLLQKEVRRYLSSSLYVMNTAVGSIMMTILTVVLLFMGEDKLAQMMEIPELQGNVQVFIPTMIAFCVALFSTTASSISLEGKNLWILKSAPISPMLIFKCKIALNLLITVPFVLLNGTLIGVALKMEWYQLLITIGFPISYAVLTAVVGLALGLKYPNFEWKSEIAVIKQGVPVMVSMLFGMVVTFAPIGAFIAMKKVNMYDIYVAFLVLALIITMGVYKYLGDRGSKVFLEL